MISPSASVYSCVSVTTSAAHQTPGGPGTRGTDSWLDDTDKKLIPIYLYCLNCTKFGQLILQKIIKIVATRCQILRLKCTKFNSGWGSAPDPAGGAYSAPLDLLAEYKGPTSKWRGREGEARDGRKGKEQGGHHYHFFNSVSETIRKPPLVKAQTALKNKNKIKFGEKRFSIWRMELLHPAMWHVALES